VDRSRDGAGERIERGLEDLARAGEWFDFTYQVAPAPTWQSDAGDAGVGRLLVSGELGIHDGVAKLSAETHGVGEVVGLIAADHTHANKDDDEGQEKSYGSALQGSEKSRRNVGRGAGGFEALAAVIDGSEDGQQQAEARMAGATM